MDLFVNRNGSGLAIDVEVMPQLLEAQNPRDDWTGMINTSERRKRQNRLNQRAYRMSSLFCALARFCMTDELGF